MDRLMQDNNNIFSAMSQANKKQPIISMQQDSSLEEMLARE